MEPLPNSPEEQSVPQPSTRDEFGELNVFSDERFAKLKQKANLEFTAMCEIIKRSEGALIGITEFLKSAEKNERAFHTASKVYVETLKTIERENLKVKF